MLTADRPPERVEVEGILDGIRPALKLDGGGVRLVSIQGWALRLEVLGSCRYCSSRPMTQRYGIEAALRSSLGSMLEISWGP
ncbi:NifU family protein [Cognatazoarcus halotolerans]|uniref:NifU family protein n=1 Tax=Cognatazoarcus halotolerans TaxID=2686016 RepID=UPI001356B63F|nr:NifU family protein [Cognatazoarcus halotolerans]MCP5233479.1 NifU family protein [Zoogloeaceae bacterium]